MTPQESAIKIVERLLPDSAHGPGLRRQMTEAIHRAIIEATNSECEKGRNLENKLAGMAGIPVAVCSNERTVLRVWNPQRQRFAELSMVEDGPGVTG